MRYYSSVVYTAFLSLFLSEIGHAQWVRDSTLSGINVLTIASHDTTLYLGTSDSVYCSTDSGAHWSPMPGSPGKVCTFAFNDSCIFAGSHDPTTFGASRSKDQGITWQRIDNGCQTPVSCLFVCGPVLFRGVSSSGFGGPSMFRSTDEGNSWSQVAVSTPVLALAQRKNEIYAGSYRTGVPGSSDSGLTWSAVPPLCGLPSNPLALEAVQALATFDTVLFAGVSTQGVFRSFDGIMWEGANSGLGYGIVSAFAVNDTCLFAGTAGGGVYLSANCGQTWTAVSNGLTDLSVQSLAVHGGFLFAGTPSGLWMRPLSEMGQNQHLTEVFPLYIGWGGRYSYARHISWSNSSNNTSGTVDDTGSVQYQVLDTLHASDSLRIWTVRQTEHIFHWEETYKNGGLYDMTSGWRDTSFTIAVNEILTGFHEIRANGKIWSFPPGWTEGRHRAFRYSPDSLFSIGVPGGRDLWSFDSRRGVFARDYHVTWVGTDTTVTIRMLGMPTGVEVGATRSSVSEYRLFDNYPNPFNPKTGIRFEVLGVSDVKIAVYDLLGREVAVLVNERKQPGTYTAEFDASRLASGVYIYRMTSAGLVQSRKMLLIK